MTELQAQNMSVTLSTKSLIDDVSFTLKQGELTVLLGPNGAGKTTTLRAFLGLQKLTSGDALIAGVSVQSLSASQRAGHIAYLPQLRPLAWPNRVRDIVSLGRFSHGAAMGRLGGADLAAVEAAITACGITHLADRNAETLSGGELARVHFARAMTAQAPFLIADEPVAGLDPRHQFRIMDLILGFVKGGGGALVVLHDISLAAKYADRLIFMKNSKVVSDGAPEDIISAKSLADIYGVKAEVSEGAVIIHGTL